MKRRRKLESLMTVVSAIENSTNEFIIENLGDNKIQLFLQYSGDN